MKLFNRETSFNEQFEVLVFRIQNSTGKVFPSRLKKLMSLFLLSTSINKEPYKTQNCDPSTLTPQK